MAKKQKTTWHLACNVNEFNEGEIKGVTIDGDKILLSLHNGKYGAIRDLCQHMGAPLSGGHMQDGQIVCPFHGWQFCHVSGEMGESCPDQPCYKVELRGAGIYVAIEPR